MAASGTRWSILIAASGPACRPLCYADRNIWPTSPRSSRSNTARRLSRNAAKRPAACHANWIGNQLDKLVEVYSKLKKDDETLEGEIKTLELAPDAHTKDNREKRTLQERRNMIAKQMQSVGAASQQGQRALAELHQSIEANLQLATHAETWEWKEVDSALKATE